MDNATRKELLYRARAAGYPGSILDVYANYDQGKDIIAEFQDQQRHQQMSQMASQQSGLQQGGQQPQIDMQPQPVAMPAIPSSPTPSPNFTPPQPPQPIGVQSQDTPVGIVSGQSGPNQGRAIFATGGFTGDPIKGFDLSKSMADNIELNRRAQVMGWNSVADYEKSGWGQNELALKQKALINNPQVQQTAKTAAEMRPDLANVQAKQDQLYANKTTGAQKAVNQVYNVLSNPIESAGHALKYGYVPQGNLGNYGQREDGDSFATIINDFANPFAWGNAAYRFSNDVTDKNSYTTGMGAANMGADLAESLPFFGAAAKTMVPAIKATAYHPLVNGLHDLVNSPKEFAKPYAQALAFKGLNSLASPLGVPLYKLPGINNVYKGAAYKIASMDAAPNRTLPEVVDALLYDSKVGSYTGHIGSKNPSKPDLVKQYIYGDGNMKKSDVSSIGLEKYTKKYGPLDTFELETNKSAWKSLGFSNNPIEFEDITPGIGSSDNWGVMNSKLKHLDNIKNKYQQRRALEKVLKKEGTLPLSINHSKYSPVNIAGHNVFLKHDPGTGKMTAQTQDIWKFTPDDYAAKWAKSYSSDLSKYTIQQQAKLMDRSGKPFILQDLSDFDFAYNQTRPVYKKDLKELQAREVEIAARRNADIGKKIKAKALSFDFSDIDLSSTELEKIKEMHKTSLKTLKQKKLGGVKKCYTCVGRKRRV